MAERARRRAERRGRTGEALAALALQIKGYRILARRVRVHQGEVDLIARRGGVLAFIEVKARPTYAEAIESVTPRAWQRISAAGEAWASCRTALLGLDWRYDIVAITPLRWPRHARDAWRQDFAATRK